MFASSLLKRRSIRYLGIGIFVLAGAILVDGAHWMRVFDQSAAEVFARSHQLRDGAHSGYASEVLAALPPSALNGPFFRLDDLLESAVVLEVSADSSAPGTEGPLWNLEFDGSDGSRMRAGSGDSVASLAEGILQVRQQGSGFVFNERPIRVPRDAIGEIVIRARATQGTEMVLALSEEEKPERPWEHEMRVDLIADSTFHTYVINAKNSLRRGLSSRSLLNTLFLRPSNVDGAVVEIDFLRLISKRSAYTRHARGASYETVGKEMRRVLYMLPTQTLEFSLRVPADSPRLDFGVAVLLEDEPVDFRVTISDSTGGPITLYDQRIMGSETWHDTRVNLSEWSGRNVSLTFGVRGAGKNVAFWSNPLISSRPKRRFNVIIVLQDALRADHLSTYGHPRPTSPAMDSVMRESGVVFLEAISQAPRTRASVPALMTSLLPTATGVWDLPEMLSDEYLTLAEVLRSQGFVTGAFIQNGNAGPYSGLHQGFGVLQDAEAIGGPTERILGAQSAVVSWIARNRQRNLFLYLHILDPHGVYNPPKPYDRWYRGASLDGDSVERTYLDPEWVERPTAEGRRLLYDGEIRHNDAQVTGFLQALDSLGLRRPTLLIFLADHGEYLGEHKQWGHHPPGHLEVLHVPLMFLYPARFGGGARIPETVQLIDVMPTVLELAGVDPGRLLLQGSSLVGLIEGRRPSFWENRLVVSEEPSRMSKDDPCLCGSLFFRGRQALISRKAAGGAVMLDGETRHGASIASRIGLTDWLLRHRYESVIRTIQANDMEAWREWSGTTRDEVYKVDPDVLKRLRDLGYVR